MYNEKILKLFKNPLNSGGLQGADGIGKYTDEVCGDCVKIYIKVDETQTITEARFKTMGSVGTIAASSAMCVCLVGCSLEEAIKIDYERIYQVTGEYPTSKLYCIDFVIKAVALAIADYHEKLEKDVKKNVNKLKAPSAKQTKVQTLENVQQQVPTSINVLETKQAELKQEEIEILEEKQDITTKEAKVKQVEATQQEKSLTLQERIEQEFFSDDLPQAKPQESTFLSDIDKVEFVEPKSEYSILNSPMFKKTITTTVTTTKKVDVVSKQEVISEEKRSSNAKAMFDSMFEE
ncbi:MAG: hypothetical protein E7378_01210 [Clostridiales bacterium]|nr:hypothetical protein [Clostridiales bacterium]